MRTVVKAVAVLVVVGGGLVGLSSKASAVVSVGSAQVVGSTLQYTAYAGFDNKVETWAADATHIVVDDSAGPIDPVAPECVATPMLPDRPNAVTCDVSGVTAKSLDGGDQDDLLRVRDPMAVVMLGGPGNDGLTAWSGNDTLNGGDGDDFLTGGAGTDLLLGGWGADSMSGGAGVDTASYADHFIGVNADADGSPGDDGAPGEGDTIHNDVETLVGGTANDVLGGTGGDDLIRGGPGADRLLGEGGADLLYGEAGYDFLDGGTSPSGIRENDTCVPGADGASVQRCEVVRES
jgi:Ca2+-binding RTX toxin-like protein